MPSIKRGMSARAAIIYCALLAGLASGFTWLETSWQDFSDGRADEGIYGSSRGGGAVDFVSRPDLNNDGYIDVVCADDSGPYLRVYFGSASGFDSARSRYYPATGGGGVDIADLDCDGHADLIASGWWEQRVTVYWGTDSGPSATDTTWLDPVGHSEAVEAFDLDRDGFLDLVCGTDSGTICIFWGSESGYSNLDTGIVDLAGGRIGQNLVIADFDKDGWADIAPADWTRNSVRVLYWGPGRHVRDSVSLPTGDGKTHGVTAADLDRDGWLDLTYTCYDNGMTVFIYYGSEFGFSYDRREMVFPGACFGGSSAAYWNGDSALDLVIYRGEYRGTGSWAPMVYFNQTDTSRHFDDRHRANIGTGGYNASGGLVADFNRDGAQDLMVNNYQQNSRSHVLWGPSWTQSDALPVNRDHHSMAREIGNRYDRGFHEDYFSSIFDGGDTLMWRSISWDDSTPGRSSLEIMVRTGNTPEPSPEWTVWTPFNNGDSIPYYMYSRRIQYLAKMRYDDPLVLPSLTEVRVEYETQPILDVGPTAILSPPGSVDSGAVVVPSVVVTNFGNRDAEFPVTLVIGTTYAETVQASLAVGASDTLDFPAWTAQPLGSVTATFRTNLYRDRYRNNDAMSCTVHVVRSDVGAVAVLSPTGPVDSGTVQVPSAVVQNFGLVTVNFPVTMRIGIYLQTVSETLAGGRTDTVSFPGWIAEPIDSIDVICYTSSASDPDRTNDTARAVVVVWPPPVHDMGTEAILEPVQAPGPGDSVLPRARIHNYGRRSERYFEVRFWIDSVYDRTVAIGLPVEPDSSIEVMFPKWTAVPGTRVVNCSTRLFNDADPRNDIKTLSFYVSRPLVLDIEADQTVSIQAEEEKDYRFTARLEGDSAKTVDLVPIAAPAGWSAGFYDAGGTQLPGNSLGTLVPDRPYEFALRVKAPPGNLAGVIDSFATRAFAVKGYVRDSAIVSDSALLTLSMLPLLEVHNFPNPLEDQTRFVIGLPEDGDVSITIYNRAGECIRQLMSGEALKAGVNLVDWDAKSDGRIPVGSGTYRYVFEYARGSGTEHMVGKLVVIRK